MQKIKVFVQIQNQFDHECLNGIYDGFLTPEKIVYLEDKRTVTILKKSNTITMIRRDQESSTFLTFLNNQITTGHINHLRQFVIQIKTSLLEIFENQIHIVYQTMIDQTIMGIFDFHLRYEVIK